MARQRFQMASPTGDATPPPIVDNRRVVDEKGYQLGSTTDEAIPPAIADSRRLNGNQRYQTSPSDGEAVPPPPPKNNNRRLHSEKRIQPLSPRLETVPSPSAEKLNEARKTDQARQYQTELTNGYHNDAHAYEAQPAEEERRYQNGHQNGESESLPIMNNNRLSEDQRFEIASQQAEAMPSPNTNYGRNEGQSYFRSAPDAVSISKASAVSDASSRFADFFGPGIFQIVLHNPTTSHQLLKFSQARFCGENMEFLEKVRAISVYTQCVRADNLGRSSDTCLY